jgi:hypothetical protein
VGEGGDVGGVEMGRISGQIAGDSAPRVCQAIYRLALLVIVRAPCTCALGPVISHPRRYFISCRPHLSTSLLFCCRLHLRDFHTDHLNQTIGIRHHEFSLRSLSPRSKNRVNTRLVCCKAVPSPRFLSISFLVVLCVPSSAWGICITVSARSRHCLETS